ncbi:relaxase domain-containing protein [Pseudonocardia sp. MCCB 268]|nr:relaxase domain-containing protein [Pseudonocardia cytotoxica]
MREAVLVLKVVNGYSPGTCSRRSRPGGRTTTRARSPRVSPGRWWGAGAEKLGLTGLVGAQDMRAPVRAVPRSRADGFRDPQRWDEGRDAGSVGRRYVSRTSLRLRALEQEPYASAERRAELVRRRVSGARHNVAFLDATFSVQRSVTLLHTAFRGRGGRGPPAGGDGDRGGVGRVQVAVRTRRASNNAALAYLADKAGYSRVGHHGGAAGRWVDARDWVVGSFFQRLPRPGPAAARAQHDPQPGRRRTGSGARSIRGRCTGGGPGQGGRGSGRVRADRSHDRHAVRDPPDGKARRSSACRRERWR